MFQKIKLQNFRNYEDLEIELSRGNIFIGNNGQGKTNILEAVSILSSTKSFRSKDNYLVKEDCGFCTILGVVSGDEMRVVEEIFDMRVRKTFQFKGVKKSAKNFVGLFKSVIFSPDDVAFLNDSPGVRRRYLDIILSISDRNYLEKLIQYKKILEQRNALLKRIKDGFSRENELEVWDEKMVDFGDYLIKKRVEFIHFVNENISFYYNIFSEKKDIISIEYCFSTGYGEYLSVLKDNWMRDISSTRTSVGPHRDDIKFMKNNKEMAPYGSRGEYRTAVLSLKFSEGKYLESLSEEKVTYLLDDVFSELDKGHREKLFELIKENPYIITTTDLDHIGESLLKISKVFRVDSGEVSVISNL